MENFEQYKEEELIPTYPPDIREEPLQINDY
jgi:hypothetical protein